MPAVIVLLLLCAFNACTTPPTKIEEPYDPYAVFRESRPRSILVMPPVNRSPDIGAQATFLATAALPLAEAGYYVIPAALSAETFKQNGVTVAEEAAEIPFGRLREIFGADAALYITITRYGVTYVLIDSVVEAAASARLVDLRSGQDLWSGQTSVTSGNESGGSDLAALLVSAAINQIANTLSDRAYDVGRKANYRMLSAGHKGGILYGPNHPKYIND
jgi:hypothetical protein